MKYEYIKIDNNIEAVPELELYFSANETQLLHYYEPELGLFVAESPMVIERALMAGYEAVSYVMIDNLADEYCRRFSELVDEYNKKAGLSGSPEKTVPVYVGSYETIAGLTGVNITRGVLALMKRRALPTLSEVIRDLHHIAIFDDVENPTNIGAMFRSAAALGMEAVILAGASSDPLYRRASRVSVGTVFQVPWTKLSRNHTYINELHDFGFRTAAMVLADNCVNINDPRLKAEEKLAIILGNEGVGLSEEVLSASDYVIKIPMKNGVDSLNVAAASSIVFWELR